MQVFNAYFKIIKKNIPQMMIFLGVFAALAVAFSNLGVGNISSEFVGAKPAIAIFSEDSDTVLLKGFTDYMGTIANIVKIDNNEDAIQDALFFRKVTYIIRIPTGFTDNLLKNQPAKLEQKSVPDSYDSMYLDYAVNKFCKEVQLYSTYAPKYTQEEIVKAVVSDLSKSSTITMRDLEKKKTSINNSIYFFNYFAYSLLAIILLGITSFMITFQNVDLRRRNASSPMTAKSMNLQLVAGNVIFAVAVWAVMFGLAFLLFGKSLLNITAIYYGINTIIYTLVCVSLSFLVGNLTQSRNAQAAIVNVLALGLSFISGVFVPQFLLGETVLRIASFTPTYWFIRANQLISEVDTTADFSLRFISTEILVQLLFIVILFSFSTAIIRYKRTSNS